MPGFLVKIQTEKLRNIEENASEYKLLTKLFLKNNCTKNNFLREALKKTLTLCDVKGLLDQSSVQRERKYYQWFLLIYIERSGIQNRANISPVRALSMLTNNRLTTEAIANMCT